MTVVKKSLSLTTFTFSLSLSLSLPKYCLSSKLTKSLVSPNIGASVRLQKTSLITVTEGVNSSVSICAEIYRPTIAVNCPVIFEFEINLVVGEGTESNH